MTFADLHLHTDFSDGAYSPAELVKHARHAGLGCIAVVDHDTVLGVKPTLEAARKINGLEVLPGIELSAEYKGREVHILGYLIDHKDRKFIKELDSLKKNRISRAHKILKKLQELGLDLRPQDIPGIAGKGTVGRLHIARAMVERKLVTSIAEAFRRYIADDRPAYVLGFKFSPAQAIKLIKDAGGIPVLAHPYLLGSGDSILEIIKCGIMGLEVYYPQHSPAMVKKYLALSRKFNLLVTGGSDCHGPAKPEARIGSVRIPYELVEKIKKVKKGMK